MEMAKPSFMQGLLSKMTNRPATGAIERAAGSGSASLRRQKNLGVPYAKLDEARNPSNFNASGFLTGSKAPTRK
jgi:hypothetical protein